MRKGKLWIDERKLKIIEEKINEERSRKLWFTKEICVYETLF